MPVCADGFSVSCFASTRLVFGKNDGDRRKTLAQRISDGRSDAGNRVIRFAGLYAHPVAKRSLRLLRQDVRIDLRSAGRGHHGAPHEYAPPFFFGKVAHKQSAGGSPVQRYPGPYTRRDLEMVRTFGHGEDYHMVSVPPADLDGFA